MKKNKCEQCGIDFERHYIRRFCCKKCWHIFNSKTIASYNDTRFQWKNCTDEEKLERIRIRFESKVIKSDGCWGWNGHLNKNGYTCLISGCRGKGFKERYGHRISWLLFRGEIPEGKVICHSCDNPKCTNPDHLWLGTHQENLKDMQLKQRGNLGTNHGNSILDDEDVREIRKMYDNGIKVTNIMEIFKLGRAHIHLIGKRKSWKHVI